MKLERELFLEEDPVRAARTLLGKLLVTRSGGVRTAGIITETEAYAGTGDRASHAYGGRRTKRNGAMYAMGGTAYVYLCYGIHHLFNVVTHREGVPHAILVRGIHPLEGLTTMRRRRHPSPNTTNGPGTAAQALGIHIRHNGLDLLGDRIWLEDIGCSISEQDILVGPRIGVAYAGEDALLPYRFLVAPSCPLPHAHAR